MSRPPDDLRCLGARALPTRALVRLLLGARAGDDDVDDAARALALHPRAREAALLQLAGGPRLLAAVELGRRAWLSSPPVGARITGPSDAAAVAGPRLVDDQRALLLVLDVRGRLARMAALPEPHGDIGDDIGDADGDDDVARVLQEILMAGCRRGLLVRRRPGPAVPGVLDVDRLRSLRRGCGVAGVDVVDGVLLGDDGLCSLLRLGLIGVARDRRYG